MKEDAAQLQRRANQQRHMARRLAMQALYQWQITGQTAREVITQFRSNEDYFKTDKAYFAGLVEQAVSDKDVIGEDLKDYLSRDFDLIDPVERAVLMVAVLELKFHLEVPYRVVINEAVSLTKKYGATDAHKFVNGVLDKACKAMRSMEIAAQQPKS